MIAASVLLAALAFRVWTVDDGLAQGSVFAIEQTPDGYLWIATLDGLVRFDGARMKRFSRSDHPEMVSNRILALRVDREGSLWIGTEDGGAIRMKDGAFRSYGAADGLTGTFVTAFDEDASGRLWATTSAGLARLDGERWSLPPEGQPPPGGTGFPFTVGWRRAERVHVLEHGGGFVGYTLPNAGDFRTFELGRDPRGGAWLRTGETSFATLQGGTVTPFALPGTPGPYAPGSRFAAARGADGRSWVLSNGRLHQLDRRWETVLVAPVPEVASSPVVLFEDREGSLWVGSETGLAQAFPTPIRSLAPGGERVENNFYPVAESRDGRLWAGSQSYPFVVTGDRFRRLDALRNAFVVATTFEPQVDGSVLVATPGKGVLRVSSDLEVEPYLAMREAVADLLRDRRGRTWLATGVGLFRVEGGTRTRFGPTEGMAGSEFEVLLEGADGALWVGGRGGLSRIEGDRVTSWTAAQGSSIARVRALHEDDRGSLWIGTYDGGLARLREGKLVPIRERDGLGDDGVFAIVDDGMGRFWMSSNRGIHVAERAELDAFADGTLRRVASRSFGRADGMASAECNGGMQPSGIRRKDGTIVFPTQHGLAVVDPRALRPSAVAPNVVIEEVASEHRAHAVAPRVDLAPDEHRLEVRFTATTFLRPGQARFRYRLDGLDDGWAEAGTDRFARYSHVPPGDYVFRATASNGDGLWNETGASFALHVRPAWWQTRWLRTGVGLAFVGAVVTGFRMRIARLKRRRAEQDHFARQLLSSQEAERKRIAGELHDGIGQTLVVIRNRALLGLRDADDPARSRRQSQEIVDAASSGIDEIRKVTHNLRPYQLDRLGLERAVEAIVEQAGASSEIELTSSIDPLDGVFPQDDEIAVYRIVQEAVSNLVRHAGAKKARVAVRVLPEEVEIRVEDDGSGFDPEGIPTDRRGMGLSGIAERVRILGGRRTIDAAPGRGTRVVVRLPRRGTTE